MVARFARALIALSLLGAPVHAAATVAVPLTTERMLRESHVVVHGEVLMKESFWDGQKGRIYTHTRVRVLRSLHGKATETELLVRQWGGQVGGVAMAVPGNAAFKPGEEVVLFLMRDDRYHYVVGLAQGKYHVSTAADGRKTVSRDLSGLSFARWDRSGRMRVGPRFELERPMTLDALEAEIKAAQTR